MAEINKLLGLDQTFFQVFFIFFALFVVLKLSYFKPFLSLFQRRRAQTVEDHQKALAMVQEAENIAREYQRHLLEAKQKAEEEAAQIVLRAKEMEAKILAEAREEAQRVLQSTQSEIQKQKEQLRVELFSKVDDLSKQLLDQILAPGK